MFFKSVQTETVDLHIQLISTAQSMASPRVLFYKRSQNRKLRTTSLVLYSSWRSTVWSTDPCTHSNEWISYSGLIAKWISLGSPFERVAHATAHPRNEVLSKANRYSVLHFWETSSELPEARDEADREFARAFMFPQLGPTKNTLIVSLCKYLEGSS